MKIVSERQEVTQVVYCRKFTDKNDDWGFGFYCTKEGEPLNLEKSALDNYNRCLAGEYANLVDRGVQKHENRYMQGAIGICDCGQEIELYDQYRGTCECPICGRWWDMQGQEVGAPFTSDEGDYDEEYDC